MGPAAKPPRFSILIPTYNRQELVCLTVESVLAQSFGDYELIVIDDGSTDQTVKRLEAYGPCVKILVQKNSGPEIARRNGAALATGDYLVLLDNDDLLYPWALSTYDRLIRALGSPPLLLGAVYEFTENRRHPEINVRSATIEYLRFRDFLSKDVSVNHICSQIVIKRSEAEAMKPLRTGAWPYEPSDIMLRLATCQPFVVIQQPYMVGYRMHATNTIWRRDFPYSAFLSLARAERRGEYPGGSARRFDRRAYIGGMALFSMRWAMRRDQYRLALHLLLHVGTMMPAALLKRFTRLCRKRTATSRMPLNDN
ncbi:MAG: glycosyltransferase family 2 protein [Nibricoccus sp.]